EAHHIAVLAGAAGVELDDALAELGQVAEQPVPRRTGRQGFGGHADAPRGSWFAPQLRFPSSVKRGSEDSDFTSSSARGMGGASGASVIRRPMTQRTITAM